MPSTPSRRSGRSAARSPHAHPDLTEQRELAVSSQKSASPTVVSPITVPASGSFLRVWMVIALFLFAGTALSITVHSRFHGFNPLQASLAFFLTLNVLICFWEISLGLHIIHINSTFKAIQDTKFWSRIWAAYSLYDPSYSNRDSTDSIYGVELPGALAVGVMGIIKFYQELYGCILYFFSFFFNGRHRGIPIAQIVGWVGGSNGIWIIFPAIGMYASFQLISTRTFDAFRT